MLPFQTKRDYAVARLREDIIRGELVPGTRLILEDLAQQHSLSLTPIREALPILEAEGFIRMEPHKGAVVSPMDREEILELYTIRTALEAMVAREAVPQVTEAQVDEMATLAERLVDFRGDWESFLNLDKQFHLVLYAAAGSRRWVETINTLWQRSKRYMMLSSQATGASTQIHEDHRRLIEACRQRDAVRVEAVVREHLIRSERRLLKQWI